MEWAEDFTSAHFLYPEQIFSHTSYAPTYLKKPIIAKGMASPRDEAISHHQGQPFPVTETVLLIVQDMYPVWEMGRT
jgi:hypothetical protein